MSWIQIEFTTREEHQELLEDSLLGAGAVSITYTDGADQPILEPGLHQTPLWDALKLTALFDKQVNVEATLAEVEQSFGQNLPEYSVDILQDRDWEREWMDDFIPIQFGKRLWVCPSWHEPSDPDAVNIELDPGLAFGTGTHPTTAMCLRTLDGLDVKDKSVLDIGCGSGILAIAALLLGAKDAVGTDIDPQALTASRENADRNNIPAEQFTLHLAGEEPKAQYDIVLANILAGPLVELAPTIMSYIKPGGLLLLSGLLIEQQNSIVDAYTDICFENVYTEEQWLCLQGMGLRK